MAVSTPAFAVECLYGIITGGPVAFLNTGDAFCISFLFYHGAGPVDILAGCEAPAFIPQLVLHRTHFNNLRATTDLHTVAVLYATCCLFDHSHICIFPVDTEVFPGDGPVPAMGPRGCFYDEADGNWRFFFSHIVRRVSPVYRRVGSFDTIAMLADVPARGIPADEMTKTGIPTVYNVRARPCIQWG